MGNVISAFLSGASTSILPAEYYGNMYIYMF